MIIRFFFIHPLGGDHVKEVSIAGRFCTNDAVLQPHVFTEPGSVESKTILEKIIWLYTQDGGIGFHSQ